MISAPSPDEESLPQALHHMKFALEILDRCEAPADIGAHLDLAICRAQECLCEVVNLSDPSLRPPH